MAISNSSRKKYLDFAPLKIVCTYTIFLIYKREFLTIF